MVSASASFGTLISSMPTNAPRPNGKLMVVRSQFLSRMKRLVAIAKGMIGRPDSRASMMMPSPATRALRDIGGQCHIIVVLERLHHFPEGPDATFTVEGAAMVAGAADGADAEP